MCQRTANLYGHTIRGWLLESFRRIATTLPTFRGQGFLYKRKTGQKNELFTDMQADVLTGN
jgi:hypothetical protein